MLLLLACADPLPVPEDPEDTACEAVFAYRDNDGDGFGDASRGTSERCVVSEGYSTAAGDCDDADAERFPDATERCDYHDDDCDGVVDDAAVDADSWYADLDGDGFGAGEPVSACDAPAGFVASATDCDDTDADVNPNAPEVCGGVDEDCDGDTTDGLDPEPWFTDADGDGFGDPYVYEYACDAPAGTVADHEDCDDTNGETHPGAAEHCNGTDDDCDGFTDEGAPDDATTWYGDADGDGHGDPAVTLVRCELPTGHVADAADCDPTDAAISPDGTETCDGADQDCDGAVDEGAIDAPTWHADADGDGFGDPDVYVVACDGAGYVATATDCDDADVEVSPGGIETCDGVDEDCDGTIDEDAIDAPTWYGDADGDGYGDPSVVIADCSPVGAADATDCDDGDAAIHPGADETCASAADDDCDGEVDEDPVDGTSWYADLDGDGRGDPDTLTVECTRPRGYLDSGTDCDDADSTIHPGQTEICDGVDEDCDGTVDEDASDCTSWWADSDGDGWGGTDSTCTCAADAAYPAAEGGDCDDAEATTHPEAAEIWGDDIDQDCNGDADIVTVPDAGWEIAGETPDAELGTAMFAPGDADGDGRADLVVGEPGSSGELGAVYWFGALEEGSTLGDAAVFTGAEYWDNIGSALAAGDLDGDGWTDLIVGGPGRITSSFVGAAWVFSDLSAGGRSVSDADFEVEGEGADALGTQVALVGDLDGDGVVEWALGAPGHLESTGEMGEVLVYSGLPTTTSDPTWTLLGPVAATDTGGYGLAGIGDVDGDGLDDFAIGAPTDGSGLHTFEGTVFVHLGVEGTVEDGMDVIADAEIAGAATRAYFGTRVAGGDCDGDGLGDLVASVLSPNTLYIFADVLSATSVRDANTTWTLTMGRDSGLTTGDADADGLFDVFVGAPLATNGAYLLSGCPAGSFTSSDAALTIEGESGAYTGTSVAILGDAEGDGGTDLAVGATEANDRGGAAWIVWGP